MSLFSRVESGTRAFHSRFHKSISYRKMYDCEFGAAVPVLEKFCLPGDVWRIGGKALIRFLPMTSPTMTKNTFYVRYFFVPLRLIEENAELIITGSDDGHLHSGTLPTFKNFVQEADKVFHADAYKVKKYSFYDYLGVPIGDYESIKNDECLPAGYWYKGWLRINWDFYRDENLQRTSYTVFEDYWTDRKRYGADVDLNHVALPKDYFTSALPWQLKGVAPVLTVTGSATLSGFDFGTPATFTGAANNHVQNNLVRTVGTASGLGANSFVDDSYPPFAIQTGNSNTEAVNKQGAKAWSDQFASLFNGQQVNINGLGFTADDERTMMAQTRVFERLARTGSRYTEYLHANFGVAPADGTLQRAQYLGGWKLPIVTTEVLQTAEDGSNPVGTMRGHGITNGGNVIKTFHCKEFGLLFGVAYVLPKIQYTQGIKRELTYKRRFDFFNPSFQHLSEQEVRNGELYIDFSDGLNDDTFGFQAYANELRTSVDMVVGNMRDGLSNWNQAIHFSTRPNLNAAFINSKSYIANFNQSFVQTGATDKNIIVDFYNDLDVYRPMVRYSTPGLVDHL